MISRITFLAALGLLVTPALSHAHEGGTRPDDHAPIGVMGDHRHKEGEWMLGFRSSAMHMEGLRNGSDGVSTASVLGRYRMSPQEMDMSMQMLGVMYGASDDLTLMAMLPYIDKEMTALTRMGMRFNTQSEGIGDVRASALWGLYEAGGDRLHLNLSLSLPTGSIDERDDTPMMRNARLPYGMQLGSGTVDPTLGMTYVSRLDGWSWGAQALATLRLYDNSHDYHLGNEYKATSWIAHAVTDALSLSARVEASHTGDIRGADPALNPMMSPAADGNLRGGEKITAFVGANLYAPNGYAEGHRIAAELGFPLYQHLNGPQLEEDYRFTLGWQYAF